MGKKSLVIILLFLIIFAINLGRIAEAKKIVSLAPSITETLFLLGLGKQIVGVSANCDYPDEAKQIEKTGWFGSPNLEKIVSLKPDLVLASDLGVNSTIARLRDLNITTLVLPSRDMNEVMEGIETLGRVMGREEKAKRLVQKMQRRIETIKKRVANRPKPKVLVILWVNPNTIMTAGRRSFINELISLAGGKNITARLDFHYPMISPEFILAENPDIIILGDSLNNENSVKHLLNLPGIKNTRAVKSGRIYRDLNSDLFLRPGPRLIDGLEEIAGRLHPR